MQANVFKRMFYLSISIMASLALLAFGSVFLFMTSYNFTDAEYIIFSSVLFILAIFIASSPEIKQYWWLALLLVVNSVYFLARATGSISQPWLARIIGVASWLAALLLIYVAWHFALKPPVQASHEKRDK